jgi:hypothetical protein
VSPDWDYFCKFDAAQLSYYNNCTHACAVAGSAAGPPVCCDKNLATSSSTENSGNLRCTATGTNSGSLGELAQCAALVGIFAQCGSLAQNGTAIYF